MSSLRLELQPFAAAASPEALLVSVRALRWSALTWDALTWELAHERRGLLPPETHVPSPELCARLSAACGRAERMRVPSGEARPSTLRFACVETPELCLFGLVAFAPCGFAEVDGAWGARPHPYSAALPPALARLALNLALAHGATSIVDPCCGSGTILFAAACAGVPALGLELHPLVAAHAKENLDWAASRLDASFLAPAVFQHDSSSLLPLPAALDAGCSIISNLPFGRMACVGGAAAASGASHDERATLLLSRLRPLAATHIYFAEASVTSRLLAVGYANVREACVCRVGRRFICVAERGLDAGEAVLQL